ncbi:MAG TPA: class II aldolase/adducin family protein [Candidatus Thermoplasmatota archaeon]|nr:class II aldolase/adducin family protein [Candidatus Thermoplasmatota archaeon]
MTRPLFLGSDVVATPEAEALVAAAHRLSKAGVTGAALSARVGPRFAITAGGMPLDMVGMEHIVEVVDYDPHIDQILCIGPQPPSPLAPLHALVYRAKKEVWAILQTDLPAAHPARAGAPAVTPGRTHLEGSLKLLEALRTSSVVQYGKTAVFSVGRTVDEAARRIAPEAEA